MCDGVKNTVFIQKHARNCACVNIFFTFVGVKILQLLENVFLL